MGPGTAQKRAARFSLCSAVEPTAIQPTFNGILKLQHCHIVTLGEPPTGIDGIGIVEIRENENDRSLKSGGPDPVESFAETGFLFKVRMSQSLDGLLQGTSG